MRVVAFPVHYRAAFERLRALGLIVSACSVALFTHLLLQLTDHSGEASAFGTHEHGSLPIVVASIGLGALVMLGLYIAHVVRTGPRSLPIVAGAMRRSLAFRAAALVATSGLTVLAAMELAEQASIGVTSFAGVLDDRPVVALGFILLCSAFLTIALRGLCTLLMRAHRRIATALFALIDLPRSTPVVAWRLTRAHSIVPCSARCISRIFGMRAPPVVLPA